MNKARMRSLFRTRCSGLANGLSDGDVDTYLTESYACSIPDMVPGQITDGEWTLTTTASVNSYNFPDWVHSVREGTVLLDASGDIESWLDAYTRKDDFDRRHRRSSTTSKPTAVLMYGRAVRFDFIPDDEYNIEFNVRKYPSTGSPPQLASIPDDIPYYNHANAVVWSSCKSFAQDVDEIGIGNRAEAGLQMAISLFAGRELTRRRRQRARTTF